MSLIGKQIGDFKVNAFQNGDITEVSKESTLGKWSLFFFYPADFTFVCPTELEDLANNYDKFQAAGAEVYSVSCDTEFVHKAWHEESERISKVTYPMLADPAHVLARNFEVLIEDAGLAERGAFIVDPEGVIQVELVTAGGIGRNAEELLRLLQAAQFVAEHGDQGCPAKWQPGAETLKPSLDLVGQLYDLGAYNDRRQRPLRRGDYRRWASWAHRRPLSGPRSLPCSSCREGPFWRTDHYY